MEPGDVVLAADPGSGVWSYETVLDQWSASDDGQLVTAVLVDGSEVTATDHHLFWVDSSGAWVELEDVQPGDTLLTPDGVTTVDYVVVSSEAVRTVWELDTAGPDTFTVNTGTADVLVHNQDGCGNSGSRPRRSSDERVEDIADDHAFEKHVEQNKADNPNLEDQEFPDVRNREEFLEVIKETMEEADHWGERPNGDRWWFDSKTGTFVVDKAPPDVGTAFRPDLPYELPDGRVISS